MTRYEKSLHAFYALKSAKHDAEKAEAALERAQEAARVARARLKAAQRDYDNA